TAVPWPLPPEDVALIGGFTLLPLGILIAALWVTNAFVFRYAIAGAMGPAMLAPILLHRLFGGRQRAALLFVAMVCITMVTNAARSVRHFRENREAMVTTAQLLKDQNPKAEPVLIADYESFMSLWYYSDAGTREQIVYLVDP